MQAVLKLCGLNFRLKRILSPYAPQPTKANLLFCAFFNICRGRLSDQVVIEGFGKKQKFHQSNKTTDEEIGEVATASDLWSWANLSFTSLKDVCLRIDVHY